MPLLQGVLQIRDVLNVEKLAARALNDELRRIRATLNGQEFEDALAYLVAVVWESSVKYDPRRSSSFSQYAYRICRLRLTDWYRARYGDLRSGPAKRDFLNTLSLDAPAHGASDDGSSARPLGDSLEGGSGDPQAGSPADLLRALHGGRRQTIEDTNIIRNLASPPPRRRA